MLNHPLVQLGILAVIGSASTLSLSTTSAQEKTFTDVEADYWATPFIQVLAEKDIITGYLDGTYRPEKPLDRDEFAAIIRQAFNQEKIRDIPSGAVFEDVPQGNWAAPPIEEAYESGFMKDYPNSQFRPHKKLSKLEALISLSNGLDLSYNPTQVNQTSPQSKGSNQDRKPKVAKNRLLFPLASTALMQPFVINKSQPKTTPTPSVQETSSPPSAQELVNSYYQDADQIPESAVDDVAAATKANLVVNHPQKNMLNPTQTLTRGNAAAIIHQALVHQGRLSPLDADLEVSQYIVDLEE